MIIYTRYDEALLTIITTNYFEGYSDSPEETLEERIGKGVRSRLSEMSREVLVVGEDYRLELAPPIKSKKP